MSIALDRFAPTDVPLLGVLAERWSTRVFDATEPLDEEAFVSAVEAARWAPSANNTQPWRLIVARRGSAEHTALVGTLMGFNQTWAGDAAALVVVVAETANEDGTPMHFALYDAGQAAAHFTVQAHAGGLATHQMGGFDRDAVRATFNLDSRFEPLTAIAVGAFGDIEDAPEAIREREIAPRTRRPIADSLLVNA